MTMMRPARCSVLIARLLASLLRSYYSLIASSYIVVGPYDTLMDVTIFVPRRVDDSCPVDVDPTKDHVLLLQVHRSRILWRELHPCLFSKNKRNARVLIQCIFMRSQSSVLLYSGKKGSRKATTGLKLKEEAQDDGLDDKLQSPRTYRRRKLRLTLPATTTSKKEYEKYDNEARRVILWIQPPFETRMEPYFTGLLNKWEHELIQAQSLAAYFATLGGGFFLCRHLQTALALAKQQQRMAAFLGDTAMYYRCLINQAYNYIYAGHFGVANKIIRKVQTAAEGMRPGDDVLILMCSSALLFSKRVRKARQTPATEQSLMTKDDLYRIRMVQDQSLPSTDVTAPFRRK